MCLWCPSLSLLQVTQGTEGYCGILQKVQCFITKYNQGEVWVQVQADQLVSHLLRVSVPGECLHPQQGELIRARTELSSAGLSSQRAKEQLPRPCWLCWLLRCLTQMQAHSTNFCLQLPQYKAQHLTACKALTPSPYLCHGVNFGLESAVNISIPAF